MFFTTGNLLTLGIVLVALVLYRQIDRNNRSLDKVRKYGEKLRDDLTAFVADKEASVRDYGVELDVQRKSAKELLNRIASVEEGLSSRADGIAKIDERIGAYDKSLEELLRMTSRAQENLDRIREESGFTDGVQKRLKEAKEQVDHLEKSLGDIEIRFERENAEALERTAEATISAVRSTVTDLQETAETIERRVEDHRDAVVKIERERKTHLAEDAASIEASLEKALESARTEANQQESAAFQKLKEQSLERARRFHDMVEEKFGQLQESSKARLVEVQGLVRTFKSDWQKDAQELVEKQKAQRDELRKEAADLAAIVKTTKDDWKKDALELRSSFDALRLALKSEGAELITQAADAVKEEVALFRAENSTSLHAARDESERTAAEIASLLAESREETARVEQASLARLDGLKAAVDKIEMDFRRRAAALEEATTRIGEQAMSSAAEDASRRQGEIRAAVETSIGVLSDRLTEESSRVEEGVKTVQSRGAELSVRLEKFVDEFGTKLSAAAEEASLKALAETDERLAAYRAASASRFERLESLADDIGRLDAELRRSMASVEDRVREDFILFERDSENGRAALAAEISKAAVVLRTDMEGVEKELSTLKSRAYENVSEKLKLFEDDFFADLSKRSEEIDRRLVDWKASIDESLTSLGEEATGERARLETSYAEELKQKLAEQTEKSLTDLERLKEQTGAFEEGVREQLAAADQSLQYFKDQLGRDLEEARSGASVSTKAEIARHSLQMSELIKKDQRELDLALKELSASVEGRKAELAERLEASRLDMETWQASVARQLREADTAVDEARKRAREMAVESDERLASTRTAIQEARDEADAFRTELVKRTEERVGTVDAAVKDVDRRVKEFVVHTKLFDRAEELRSELERRMEDLGSDLERLDQRRSETAELESQFVKIKRLEDEVNSKMTRFLSEKRRIELMESDFKRLLQTAQSVDDKLAQVTASDDTLQALQAQLRRLEDAVGEAETKYERLEKKNQILDATADGIDRNFQALREADANAKRFDEELRRLGEGILSAKAGIDRLLGGKDRADEVAEKLGTLDSVLSDIEKRMDVMQKAREWLARTETRLEEVTKQAQEQVKIMGTLLKAEGAKGTTKDRGGAPPIGVRETVVKLAHQGWSIDEISRAVKLSKGEVELILEISPKT